MNLESPTEIALDFLRNHRFLTMATASKSGIPNATPHEYSSETLEVFLEISQQHVSVKNLMENPLVHFEIHDVFTPESAGGPKVLQLFANVTILYPTSPQFDDYWTKLTHRFPYMKMFTKETRVILVFHLRDGILIEFSKTGLNRIPIKFI